VAYDNKLIRICLNFDKGSIEMKELFVVVGIFTGFIAFVFMCSFGLVSLGCADYASQTGKETKSSYGSCYIKHNNEWYSWEEYKLRNITAGAK
jgi:hypothetical protein